MHSKVMRQSKQHKSSGSLITVNYCPINFIGNSAVCYWTLLPEANLFVALLLRLAWCWLLARPTLFVSQIDH